MRRVSVGSILVCDRGFLRSPSRLLLLNYLVLFSFLELINKALPASHFLEKAVLSPVASPVDRQILVTPNQASAMSELSLPASLPLIRRELRKKSSQSSPSPPPDYSSLTSVEQLSPSSSRLSQPSARRNQDVAPQSSHMPPPIGDTSPSDSNASSIPYGLVQPPLSPHRSGCCEPNMVPKRDSQTCNCVYPVKVELFLQNVSLSSNLRNEFLEELASQLNLHVAQFEIDNFYVVGVSGLNISMVIAPHTGISFSADQVNAMNYSLTSHKVRINPMLVGDYRLLNFTWFQPLAPSPAPSWAMSPRASQPSTSYPHTSQIDAKGDKHSSLAIVVGICAGVLIIVIITSVVIICSCKSGKGEKMMLVKETAKPRTADGTHLDSSLPHPTSNRFFSYEELKEATNNFEPACVLGEGGFGRVYKGILRDGTAVAIKKLTNGGHQGDKEFLVEVEMLSRLHHRNLVRLVGYYGSRDSSQNLLCYELVSNGSLESWLHGPLGANCPLDWDTRMKIALDAARGLAYLHEDSQPCVIHRDFKASNILLENNFHAKVSDFGLAKQAPEGQANYLSTRVMGTFGYVAPEYAMTGHLLVKSDVYSYGVVLLELLTGRRPVDMSQPSGQENLVTWARPILRNKDRLEELADPRLAGKYPKEDFMRVCTIAAACVAPEASQRPTMGEVVQSLKMVQRLMECQDTVPVPSARPIKQSSTTYESDGTSSMFSSGPFSGLSLFDNENISKTAVFSEDLHEGR